MWLLTQGESLNEKCFSMATPTHVPRQEIKVAVDFLWQGFRAGLT